MSHVLAQVRLAADSGLAEDVTINTFHFDMVPNSTNADLVGDALDAYYQAVDEWLATVLNATGNEIRFYDMTEVPPRVPFHTYSMSNLILGSGSLPQEVALCMSFQGGAESGEPQARRRGRIYLGPMSTGANTSTSGRPSQACIDDVVAGGAALLAAAQAAPEWAWIVWSPTGNEGHVIMNGWVDNAFDTQRRRGVAPSARSTF